MTTRIYAADLAALFAFPLGRAAAVEACLISDLFGNTNTQGHLEGKGLINQVGYK